MAYLVALIGLEVFFLKKEEFGGFGSPYSFMPELNKMVPISNDVTTQTRAVPAVHAVLDYVDIGVYGIIKRVNRVTDLVALHSPVVSIQH